MSFGLSNDGFKIKRLQDIKSELESAYRAVYGDLRTDADSNAGQQIGVQSEVISLIWELLQNIYLNQYPATANGLSLDYLLLLNGLTRLPATTTDVWVGVDVVDGTYIPDSFTIQDSVSKQFSTLSDVTVDYSVLSKIYFSVKDLEENTAYTITLNSNVYTVTTDYTPTRAEIAQSFVDLINADVNAGYTASIVDVDNISIFANASFIYNSSSSNLTKKIGLLFESVIAGEIPATVGSITNIVTGIGGVSSVYNFEEGLIGRDIETDDEARVRRLESLQVTGGATVEAIRSRLLNNVEEINEVTVIENDTDLVVDGIDPHSIECIVSGANGRDSEIAQEIFNSKGAGIGTNGNNTIVVPDSQGFNHTIMFSRAVSVPIYISVTITLNPEETFPTGGIQAITDALVAFGTTYKIGEDVIIQKLYKPIYSVSGIANASVLIGKTYPASSSANLTLQARELGVIADSQISIVIA